MNRFRVVTEPIDGTSIVNVWIAELVDDHERLHRRYGSASGLIHDSVGLDDTLVAMISPPTYTPEQAQEVCDWLNKKVP